MSTDLTGKSSVVIDLKNIKALDMNEILDELGIDSSIKWSFGAGVKAANVLFHDKRTIAQGANETLDLNGGGTLKDAFGDALTMDAIKLLYIRNRSLDLTVSVFGGGVAGLDLLIMGGTTDAQKLPPESVMFWACPSAAGIVTTVNKNLYLAVSAGSGSAIIDVVALGLD